MSFEVCIYWTTLDLALQSTEKAADDMSAAFYTTAAPVDLFEKEIKCGLPKCEVML
jgi:hypothetical protein